MRVRLVVAQLVALLLAVAHGEGVALPQPEAEALPVPDREGEGEALSVAEVQPVLEALRLRPLRVGDSVEEADRLSLTVALPLPLGEGEREPPRGSPPMAEADTVKVVECVAEREGVALLLSEAHRVAEPVMVTEVLGETVRVGELERVRLSVAVTLGEALTLRLMVPELVKEFETLCEGEDDRLGLPEAEMVMVGVALSVVLSDREVDTVAQPVLEGVEEAEPPRMEALTLSVGDSEALMQEEALAVRVPLLQGEGEEVAELLPHTVGEMEVLGVAVLQPDRVTLGVPLREREELPQAVPEKVPVWEPDTLVVPVTELLAEGVMVPLGDEHALAEAQGEGEIVGDCEGVPDPQGLGELETVTLLVAVALRQEVME